jgi:hypothetical protein
VLGSLLGACQRRRNADVGERVIQLFPEMQLSHLRYMQIWEGGMILQRWGSVVSLKPLAVAGLTLELVLMNFMLVAAYIIIRRTYTNCWMRRWRDKVTFQISVAYRGGKVENLVASFSHWAVHSEGLYLLVDDYSQNVEW